MTLWQGDDTATPVYWFVAEPGADVLTGWSPFRSKRTWERGEDNDTGLGELPYSDNQYPWRDGSNPVGYLGTNFCGPEEAWEDGGVHGVTPPILTEADGSSDCCHIIPPFVYIPTPCCPLGIPSVVRVTFSLVNAGLEITPLNGSHVDVPWQSGSTWFYDGVTTPPPGGTVLWMRVILACVGSNQFFWNSTLTCGTITNPLVWGTPFLGTFVSAPICGPPVSLTFNAIVSGGIPIPGSSPIRWVVSPP